MSKISLIRKTLERFGFVKYTPGMKMSDEFTTFIYVDKEFDTVYDHSARNPKEHIKRFNRFLKTGSGKYLPSPVKDHLMMVSCSPPESFIEVWMFQGIFYHAHAINALRTITSFLKARPRMLPNQVNIVKVSVKSDSSTYRLITYCTSLAMALAGYKTKSREQASATYTTRNPAYREWCIKNSHEIATGQFEIVNLAEKCTRAEANKLIRTYIATAAGTALNLVVRNK